MLFSRQTRLAMRLIQAAEMTLQRRPEVDTGGIDFPPVDDDDDDDDDEEWSWEKLDARFKAKIQEWVKVSPPVRKIANIIYETTFSRKPKVRIRTRQRDRDYIQLVMEVDWKCDRVVLDGFDDEFEMILKKSDLYKVFGARPDQLWGIVDKGDVFGWVLYYIYMEMTLRAGRPQSPSDKQAAFQVYDFIEKNKEKYEQWIRQRLNIVADLDIRVSRPVSSYGQFFNGDFIAGGTVYWEYYGPRAGKEAKSASLQ